MPIEKYTLEEYSKMLKDTKPYLIALDDLVNEVNFGQIEVILDVRAKSVEKMTVVDRKTWLRPKAGHQMSGFVIEEITTTVKH